MAQETIKYTNGEITIVWRPSICQHTGICFRGLSPVFDPRRRPWIDPLAASSEAILEQVKKCPSGAISILNKEEENK